MTHENHFVGIVYVLKGRMTIRLAARHQTFIVPGQLSTNISTAQIRESANMICEEATRACQAATFRKHTLLARES